MSNISEKKRKEVLFSLLPQINKLNKIKEQYNELIASTQKNLSSNNNYNKKKSTSEKKLQKINNNSVETLRNNLEEKEKKIDTRKKFRKSITSITSKHVSFKNVIKRENSINSNDSSNSNKSNKTHRSFNETVINLNINKVPSLKKVPSEKKNNYSFTKNGFN